jgi:hypothetical protein
MTIQHVILCFVTNSWYYLLFNPIMLALDIMYIQVKVKLEMTHVNTQEFITSYPSRKKPDHSDQYTSEITNRYIHIF